MKLFKDELKTKRATLRAPHPIVAPGKGRGRGGRAKAKAGRPAPPPPSPLQVALGGREYGPLPTCQLTQPVVKQYMPPGVYTWRSNADARWEAHHPAARTYFSKPWAKFGGQGSALELIKEVWKFWLDWNEFSAADCPIDGLLAQAAAAIAKAAPEAKAAGAGKAKGKGKAKL